MTMFHIENLESGYEHLESLTISIAKEIEESLCALNDIKRQITEMQALQDTLQGFVDHIGKKGPDDVYAVAQIERFDDDDIDAAKNFEKTLSKANNVLIQSINEAKSRLSKGKTFNNFDDVAITLKSVRKSFLRPCHQCIDAGSLPDDSPWSKLKAAAEAPFKSTQTQYQGIPPSIINDIGITQLMMEKAWVDKHPLTNSQRRLSFKIPVSTFIPQDATENEIIETLATFMYKTAKAPKKENFTRDFKAVLCGGTIDQTFITKNKLQQKQTDFDDAVKRLADSLEKNNGELTHTVKEDTKRTTKAFRNLCIGVGLVAAAGTAATLLGARAGAVATGTAAVLLGAGVVATVALSTFIDRAQKPHVSEPPALLTSDQIDFVKKTREHAHTIRL